VTECIAFIASLTVINATADLIWIRPLIGPLGAKSGRPSMAGVCYELMSEL
jgi:hypothetical protein